MRERLKALARNKFLRNVFTLLSATSIAQAISLAIYPVLTRIYTPEEHGLFALYMSIIAITAIISTGKYEMAVMIPKKEKDGEGLTVLGIVLSLVFSILLLLFIAIFHQSIPIWLGNENIGKWLYFIPASTFLVALFQTLSYWSNRITAYKTIAGANLSQSISNSAVKLSTSSTLDTGGGLIVGAIVGQAVGALYFLVRLLRTDLTQFLQLKWGELKNLAKEYKYFPKYRMVHNLINNLSSSLPVFVFTQYFTHDIVGYYGLGFMLINRPMNLLSNSFSKVFSQRIIEKHNEGKLIHVEVRKFVLRMAAIAAIPFAIILIFGPGLVSFIFGEEWHEAGVYMRIFVPWLFMAFLSGPISFLGDMLSVQKKALVIELIKISFRILALVIGVLLNNVYLALLLFSGLSVFVLTYSLFWYLQLAKKADTGRGAV